MPFGSGQLELREVIDGQQRLTTIQLLIGAAVTALARLGAADEAEILRDLTHNRALLTKGDPDAAFKVWPTKHDRAAFRAVMRGEPTEGALATHRIVDAFRFFEEAVGTGPGSRTTGGSAESDALTLVTERLNPSLSNAAWPKKRDGLVAHSLLAINRQLADGHPDAFDEDAIAARGALLARAILALWPGPEPAAGGGT